MWKWKGYYVNSSEVVLYVLEQYDVPFVSKKIKNKLWFTWIVHNTCILLLCTLELSRNGGTNKLLISTHFQRHCALSSVAIFGHRCPSSDQSCMSWDLIRLLKINAICLPQHYEGLPYHCTHDAEITVDCSSCACGYRFHFPGAEIFGDMVIMWLEELQNLPLMQISGLIISTQLLK